jgi:hypothetical protein
MPRAVAARVHTVLRELFQVSGASPAAAPALDVAERLAGGAGPAGGRVPLPLAT